MVLSFQISFFFQYGEMPPTVVYAFQNITFYNLVFFYLILSKPFFQTLMYDIMYSAITQDQIFPYILLYSLIFSFLLITQVDAPWE